MKVIFKPTGDEFAISADEDILTAALRHGINLQYGCRHGNCSSCKHWLLEGDVDDSAASVYAIPRDEREDGAILLCCSYPRTDLLIEIDQHEGSEELPPMEPPARRVATVTGVRPLTKSLVELRVRLDRTLSFRAGQYAEFLIPGTSERRSFSLASAPARNWTASSASSASMAAPSALSYKLCARVTVSTSRRRLAPCFTVTRAVLC